MTIDVAGFEVAGFEVAGFEVADVRADGRTRLDRDLVRALAKVGGPAYQGAAARVYSSGPSSHAAAWSATYGAACDAFGGVQARRRA